MAFGPTNALSPASSGGSLRSKPVGDPAAQTPVGRRSARAPPVRRSEVRPAAPWAMRTFSRSRGARRLAVGAPLGPCRSDGVGAAASGACGRSGSRCPVSALPRAWSGAARAASQCPSLPPANRGHREGGPPPPRSAGGDAEGKPHARGAPGSACRPVFVGPRNPQPILVTPLPAPAQR